jgi:hypothetical protein
MYGAPDREQPEAAKLNTGVGFLHHYQIVKEQLQCPAQAQ